jgi:hypothetical protein
MRKGTLWTFPDHIPPKGKRKKPLAGQGKKRTSKGQGKAKGRKKYII